MLCDEEDTAADDDVDEGHEQERMLMMISRRGRSQTCMN